MARPVPPPPPERDGVTDLQAEYRELVAWAGGPTRVEGLLIVAHLLQERHGPDSHEARHAWEQFERAAGPAVDV